MLAGSSGADCGYDRRGWFNSLGNNLVENAGPCVVLASDRAGDPMLGALLDNGGPTMTMPPTSTSPVFGNGMCALATDQRGRMRNTPCDIGAVDADRVAVSDAGIDVGVVDGGVVEDSGSATLDASTDDAGMLDAGALADDAMASLDSGTQDDAGAVDSRAAVPADSGSPLRDASADAFGSRDAARADGSVTALDAGAPPPPQSSCGCRVTRAHNASWWLAACALGLMIARRKKRASS